MPGGVDRPVPEPQAVALAQLLDELPDRDLVLDPVARFHLGNGASIERINCAADLSEKGVHQSAGIMINYLYRAEDIIANHEAYLREGRIVMSASVKRLLV